MPTSPETIIFIEDQLAGVAPVQIRHMFGGTGVFKDGVMFALIANDVLYLKVDESTRADFEAEGSEAFNYRTKDGRNTIMSYWRAPEDLFEEPDRMTEWAMKAIGAARRGDRQRKPRKAKAAGVKMGAARKKGN